MYLGPRLEWFADRGAWLVDGVSVFERESGGMIWTDREVGRVTTVAPRRIVDTERMLTVTGPRNEQVLRLQPIPKEEMSALRDVIASGGTAFDAGLPPLTAADSANVRPRTISTRRGEWEYEPKPVPFSAEAAAGGPIPLDCKSFHAGPVLFSRPDRARAAVGKHLDGDQAPWSTPSRLAQVVDVYDLATGKTVEHFEVPFATGLVDLSPEGTLGLFRIDKADDRLDVWDFSDGRHVVGFRPYQHELAGKRKVAWSGFVDESHVVTVGDCGKLVCWELPECRAIYSYEATLLRTAGISADRSVLVLVLNRQPRLVDALTGDSLGTLDAARSDEILVSRAIELSPDGRSLAVLFYRSKDAMLAVWSLANGEVVSQVELSSSSLRMAWCGSRHVLVDSGTATTDGQSELVDVARGFVDADGDVVWGKKELIDSTDVRNSPKKPTGMDTVRYYRLERWAEAARWLRAVEIPTPIYHPSVSRGMGESILSPSGARTIRSPSSKKKDGRTTLRKAKKAMSVLIAGG